MRRVIVPAAVALFVAASMQTGMAQAKVSDATVTATIKKTFNLCSFQPAYSTVLGIFNLGAPWLALVNAVAAIICQKATEPALTKGLSGPTVYYNDGKVHIKGAFVTTLGPITK